MRNDELTKNDLLQLIGEELKSRRMAQGFMLAGIDYTPFQPQLDNIILRKLGFDLTQDKVFDFYFALIDRHAEKMDSEADSITAHAKQVYDELTTKK